MTPLNHSRTISWRLLVAGLLSLSWAAAQAQPVTDASGKDLYNYYCFQCHGYSGDARTLATSYMDPKPRDFTRSSPEQWTQAAILAVLERGKPGTGMVSFANTLTLAQRERIAAYVVETFVGGNRGGVRYHTVENGWPDHERYAPAFPFATGEIALDTPEQDLTPAQLQGRHMFISSCVTCHDRARVEDEGPIWGLHAVSFPRRRYTSAGPPPDAITGASPYAVHDIPPSTEGMSDAQKAGQALFLVNCAFCHGGDASGQNWIGSFLIPRPRNLTGLDYSTPDKRQRIAEVISQGLPDTSMPAWGEVLGEREIARIVDYLSALETNGTDAPTPVEQQRKPALTWEKVGGED